MSSGADLVIRRGDRLPIIERTFTVNGNVVVLNQATVVFRAKPVTGGSLVIDTAATIADPLAGTVRYSWDTADATLPAGFYFAWFEATLGGKVLTAPNDGFLTLQITEDIGTFTYSGDPSARDLDKVRFLLQDTDPVDPLLTDAEIVYLIAACDGSVYQAAHDAAYAISAKFVRRADTSKSVGDLSLSTSYGNRADEFRKLGDNLLEIGSRRDAPMPRVAAASLGNTTARVFSTKESDFFTGQHDNLT